MTDEMGVGFDQLRAADFGTIQAEARWRHGTADYAPLIAELDAQISNLVLSIIRRIEFGAQTLQTQSDGLAFPGWSGGQLFKLIHSSFLTSLPIEDVDQGAFSFGPNLGRALAILEMPSGFVVIKVDEIEFGYGSVWSKIRTKIDGPAAVIAMVCLVAAQPTADLHKDLQINSQISRSISGDICESNVNFDPSIWAIRNLTASEIDPAALNAGDPNFAARICALQVLLRIAGKYYGPIDGIPGPRTMAAIRSIEEEHGLVAGSGEVFEWLIDRSHDRD